MYVSSKEDQGSTKIMVKIEFDRIGNGFILYSVFPLEKNQFSERGHFKCIQGKVLNT